MKIQNVLKIIYVFLASALIFGFTVDTSKLHFTNSENRANIFQPGGTKWKAPKFADEIKNPLSGNSEAAKEGKNLFNVYCVTCHGEKGEGNGVAAATLNPKPANLSSAEVQKQSDGAIYWKITTGFPSTAMISWRSNLSDKQRWELVNYIRVLRNKK